MHLRISKSVLILVTRMLNKKKRPIKVCSFCRKRKIKCDKGEPCSSCVKFGNDKCEYGHEIIPEPNLLAKLTTMNTKILKLNELLGPEQSEKMLSNFIDQLDGIGDTSNKNGTSLGNGAVQSLALLQLNSMVSSASLDPVKFTNNMVTSYDMDVSMSKLSNDDNRESNPYKNYSLGEFFDDANFGQFNEQFRQYQGPYTEEHDIYWENLMQQVASTNLEAPSMSSMTGNDSISMLVDTNEPTPSYANLNLIEINKNPAGFSTDLLSSLSMANRNDSLATPPPLFDTQAATISLTNPLIGADSYLKLLYPKAKDSTPVKLERSTPEATIKRQKVSKVPEAEGTTKKKHYSLADYYTDANEGKFDDYHKIINIKYSLHMFSDRFLSHIFTKIMTPDVKLLIFNFESLTMFGNLEYFLQKYYENEKLPSSDLITELPTVPEGLGFSSLASYLPTIFPPQYVVKELVDLFFVNIFCFAPVLTELELRSRIEKSLIYDKLKPESGPVLNTTSEDDIVVLTTALVICKLCNDFCNDYPGDFVSNIVIPVADICLSNYNLLQCTDLHVLQLGCMVLLYYSLAGDVEKLKIISKELLAMAINMELNEASQGIGNDIWFFLMTVNLECYLNYDINNNIVNVSFSSRIPNSKFIYNNVGSLNTVSSIILSTVPYLMGEFKKLKVVVSSLDIYDCNDQIYAKLTTIEENIRTHLNPKKTFNQHKLIMEAEKYKWLLILEGAKLSVSYQIFNHFFTLHDLIQVKSSLQNTIKLTKGAISLILDVKQFCLNNIQMSYILTINMTNIIDILFTIFINFRLKFSYCGDITHLISRLLKNLIITMDVVGLDLRLYKSWKIFNITNYLFNNFSILDNNYYVKPSDHLDDKVFLSQIRSEIDSINDL